MFHLVWGGRDEEDVPFGGGGGMTKMFHLVGEGMRKMFHLSHPH